MELRIVDTGADLDTIRTLVREYEQQIGVDLCFHGFAAELAGLPGDYVESLGTLILASEGGAPAGCVAVRQWSADGCEMKRLYVPPRFRERARDVGSPKRSSTGWPGSALLTCPGCHGQMRLLAVVKNPASIARYLAAAGDLTDGAQPGLGPCRAARLVAARPTGRVKYSDDRSSVTGAMAQTTAAKASAQPPRGTQPRR